jgi:predicted Rossmann-fold nucleotide-binding protein
MGRELVRRNIGLVYGGGNVGLMGMIADAVLKAGGEVQGVIPENLMAREVGHKKTHETPCRPLHARTQGAHG